jgi:hypothetical protein
VGDDVVDGVSCCYSVVIGAGLAEGVLSQVSLTSCLPERAVTTLVGCGAYSVLLLSMCLAAASRD